MVLERNLALIRGQRGRGERCRVSRSESAARIRSRTHALPLLPCTSWMLAGIHVPEEAIRTGLASASWPGRFERITDGTRVIVFDGAHTPAAAGALVEAWRDSEGSVRATVVLGMGADKDPRAFLTALRPLIDHLIVTRADSPRAANPDLIARAAASLGIPHEVQPSVAAAVDAVTARDAGPILITGSLFVVGEGREAFGLAEPDLEWAALNRGVTTPSNTRQSALEIDRTAKDLAAIQ